MLLTTLHYLTRSYVNTNISNTALCGQISAYDHILVKILSVLQNSSLFSFR